MPFILGSIRQVAIRIYNFNGQQSSICCFMAQKSLHIIVLCVEFHFSDVAGDIFGLRNPKNFRTFELFKFSKARFFYPY